MLKHLLPVADEMLGIEDRQLDFVFAEKVQQQLLALDLLLFESRCLLFGVRLGMGLNAGRCLLLADSVAKDPKGHAANFPPKNEISDNRRSMQPAAYRI
jgi:hypothetical protein